MSVAVYDFRLYRDSELAALQEKLQSRLRSWLADWAYHPNINASLTLSAELPDTGDWRVDPATEVALHDTPEVWSLFAMICFDREISPIQLINAPLCRAILDKAFRSCLTSLFETDDIPADTCLALPPELCRTGALALTLTVAGLSLQLILSTKRVSMLLDKPAVPAKPALPAFVLGQLPLHDVMKLSVYLKATQITLGDLTGITVGDVIKLDHPANTPFELRTEDGQILGLAYPGAENGVLQVKVGAN